MLIKLDILWFQATEIHSVRRGGYLERNQYLPELLGRGRVRPPRGLQPGTPELGTDVSLYLEGLSSLFFQPNFLGSEQIRFQQPWFYMVCLSTFPADRLVLVTSFQLLGERELCLASLSSLQIGVPRRNDGPIISALLVRMRKGLVGWAVTPGFAYCSKRMLNRFLILKD